MIKFEISELHNDKNLQRVSSKRKNKNLSFISSFDKIFKNKIKTEKEKIEILSESINELKKSLYLILNQLKMKEFFKNEKISNTDFKKTDRNAKIVENKSYINLKENLNIIYEIKKFLKENVSENLKLNKKGFSEEVLSKENFKGKINVENYKRNFSKSENQIDFNKNLDFSQGNKNLNKINFEKTDYSINYIDNTRKNFDEIKIKNTNIESTKVNINEIFEQIVQKAKISLYENKSEIVIKLKPEFLGKVVLKLEIIDNNLQGKIIVDNAFTQKLFIENFGELKVAFENLGLNITSFDIGLKEENKFEFENNTQKNQKISFYRDEIKNEDLDSELVNEYKIYDFLASNIIDIKI